MAGIAIGSMVFGRLHDSHGGARTESMQGYTIAQQASSAGPTAVVLVKGPPVASPGTRAAVIALTARLDRLPNVTGAVNAYTGRPAGRCGPPTGTPVRSSFRSARTRQRRRR